MLMNTCSRIRNQRNPSRRPTHRPLHTWRGWDGDRTAQNGERMSKSRYRPEHQRLLNDKRWTQTKAIVKARAKWTCEWCRREGIIRAGVDCHHIIPFESASTIQEAERLCYNPANVVLLCIPCHQRAHKEMGSKTKEGHKRRQDERLERWKQRHENPGRPVLSEE
jgi:5-methylcytosine-specific restriction endonuclease McrA